MRQNYDSFDYWEELISKNKTIRGHMFMDTPPTKHSIYIHTLVFCEKDGLSNVWGYFPNEKALLGYIQYSFLQEAFYKWIYGKDKMIVNIPAIPVEKIIKDGEKNNKISKQEADDMRRSLEMVKGCWRLPKGKVLPEIKKIARDFNRTWYGNHKEFLYLKVFKTAEELGEFVVSSSYMTATDDDFIDRTGISVDDWRDTCKKVISDKFKGLEFRDILLKSLTEVI